MPDKQKPTRYINCHVRKCAFRNGIANCAYCSAYPCEEVKTLHSCQDPDIKRKIAAKIGSEIPQEDYLAFIEPYQGIMHLDKIRASLSSDKFVKPREFTLKSEIVEFPEALHESSKKREALELVHRLIAAINGPVSGITFARREVLKKRRPYLLTLLWTFGLHGIFDDNDKCSLVVDSKAYYKQKNQMVYSKVQSQFKILTELGVHCEIKPLVDKNWLTDGGGLKAKAGRKGELAWVMKMSFADSVGGVDGLNALQNYTRELEKKYGNKAFRYFDKADMRIL
jgi:hypothetical protein